MVSRGVFLLLRRCFASCNIGSLFPFVFFFHLVDIGFTSLKSAWVGEVSDVTSFNDGAISIAIG